MAAVAAAPEPLFSLADVLRQALGRESLPRVHVCDVGAMILGEAEDVWKPLVRRGLCQSVVGFEPCADECDELNKQAAATSSRESPAASPEYRFLPWALGDGSEGQFRRCAAAMTSSMLEPNTEVLKLFTQLEEVTAVVERTQMKTKRLDDLKGELPGGFVDFLKLDVQGFELSCLHGAKEVLKRALVVHTEVEFVEMYKGQPLFADVDQFLRGEGFVFHRFSSVMGRPMKPIFLKDNPLQPISQQMWADAVYVRDLWELKDLSREELLKMAVVLHEIYHSYDVTHHVLKKCDEQLAKAYLDRTLAL